MTTEPPWIEPPWIAARGLAVGRRTPLLREVDWELRPGEAWFVLGRNGAGKTSLVATVLGLLPPLGGTVARSAELPRALGYVPQQLRFEPPLPVTVEEFVGLAQEQREPRSVRRPAVDAAFAALGLAGLRGRRLQELSTGQRRRVLVAQALARRPRLLVLDEPTASLDARAAAGLVADLERWRRDRGLCVVHVSHDLELARRYATHVAFVHDGRVRARPAAASWADPDLLGALAWAAP